jgi:hypothetical protein
LTDRQLTGGFAILWPLSGTQAYAKEILGLDRFGRSRLRRQMACWL